MVYWITMTPLLLATATLVPAVIVDVREQRIPNTLCLAGFLSAIALHCVLAGWGGFIVAFAAGLLALVITFPLFVLGWIGAGDVKLIAVAGATSGNLLSALAVLAAIAISGGIMVVLFFLVRRGTRFFARRFGASVSSLAHNQPYTDIEANNQNIKTEALPYAIAIATGSLFVLAAKAISAN